MGSRGNGEDKNPEPTFLPSKWPKGSASRAAAYACEVQPPEPGRATGLVLGLKMLGPHSG